VAWTSSDDLQDAYAAKIGAPGAAPDEIGRRLQASDAHHLILIFPNSHALAPQQCISFIAASMISVPPFAP
jgi:hypothetical protein